MLIALITRQSCLELGAVHVDADKAADDEAIADLAAAQAQALADAEKARTDSATLLQTAVKSRVALESAANRILGLSDTRFDMSDRDIKVAIIKHVDDDDIAADATAHYVDGAYDGALKRHAKVAGNRADTRTAIVEMRKDNALIPVTGIAAEKHASDKAKDALVNAWMTPSKDQE